MATAKKPAAAGSASSIEAQLREELAQVTTALEETDQALDEWIIECERLQGVVKSREGELRTMAEQIDELRVHSIKLEEQLAKAKEAAASSSPAPAQVGAPSAKTDAALQKKIQDIERDNAVLREQLTQSQNWVKDGLAKVEEANNAAAAERKRADDIEKERENLLKGQKTKLESERDQAVGEAKRLGAVVHAHELELSHLRQKLSKLQVDLRDAEALAGKTQAICTVAKFEAETARTDNDNLINWLKSALRWSSRL